MGRYTTVQTFSDQDAKGAAVVYNAASEPTAAPAAVANGASEPKDASKLHINRVDNVSGSSAGAGSGEFHTYRASRRREMERVAAMEKRYKENKAQQEFETKRKRNAEEFEAKMQKRAEKRRRRKERAKSKAMDDAREEHEEEQKEETSADKEQQVPETPGGVPEIPNDGSFLERMLALQKQKEESGEK
ncbi:hypothetical protein PF004_g4153 [Phytophthora fragariae]|uniref:Uncharacterized protein n=1 Tax=Phytophthora fragariae TaxID=53985 RepID=A0A6G0PJF1_9STRA|nr:hypothetical protein PF004_g4153 [Phytophthora fragariae]